MAKARTKPRQDRGKGKKGQRSSEAATECVEMPKPARRLQELVMLAIDPHEAPNVSVDEFKTLARQVATLADNDDDAASIKEAAKDFMHTLLRFSTDIVTVSEVTGMPESLMAWEQDVDNAARRLAIELSTASWLPTADKPAKASSRSKRRKPGPGRDKPDARSVRNDARIAALRKDKTAREVARDEEMTVEEVERSKERHRSRERKAKKKA